MVCIIQIQRRIFTKNYRMRAHHFIVLFALLGSPFICQGQSVSDSKFWLSVGLGKTKFIHGMITAAYEPKNKSSIIISRYSVTGELVSFVEPGLKTSEFGILYGLKKGKFSFASGLSTIWGRYRGNYMYTDTDPLFGSGQHYETVNYKTVGIPAEIRRGFTFAVHKAHCERIQPDLDSLNFFGVVG